MTCPECKGSGQHNIRESCTHCGGHSKITQRMLVSEIANIIEPRATRPAPDAVLRAQDILRYLQQCGVAI